MKPTLLISTIILLAFSGFAQTTVKNQESVSGVTGVQSKNGSAEIKNSGSASSAVNVQTSKINPVEPITYSVAEVKKSNKIRENAYLVNEAVAPASTPKNNVSARISLMAKNSNQVKAKVNKQIVPVIKVSHNVQAVSAINVKTAPIKVNTHLKGNSGIKIK